jgi:hypothetical protein
MPYGVVTGKNIIRRTDAAAPWLYAPKQNVMSFKKLRYGKAAHVYRRFQLVPSPSVYGMTCMPVSAPVLSAVISE